TVDCTAFPRRWQSLHQALQTRSFKINPVHTSLTAYSGTIYPGDIKLMTGFINQKSNFKMIHTVNYNIRLILSQDCGDVTGIYFCIDRYNLNITVYLTQFFFGSINFQ